MENFVFQLFRQFHILFVNGNWENNKIQNFESEI